MLLICAYLGAVAGLSAFCYVFRHHGEEENDADSSQETCETIVIPDDSSTPDPIIDYPPASTRSGITPESQAKIREVLAYVNTPSDELLQNDAITDMTIETKTPSKTSSANTKKPKEVIADLMKSQERVEAWISQINKVISSDDKIPKETCEEISKVTVQKGPTVVSHHETCKAPGNIRLAKVREEMNKRREVLAARADHLKKRNTIEPVKNFKNSSKSYEKTPVTVQKRYTTTDRKDASTKRSAADRKDSICRSRKDGSDKCAKEGRDTSLGEQSIESVCQQNQAKGVKQSGSAEEEKPSSSRTKPGVRGPLAEHKQEVASAVGCVSGRPKVKNEASLNDAQRVAKTQCKPKSSFEVRMRYGTGFNSRSLSPSPTRCANGKTSRSPTRPAAPRPSKVTPPKAEPQVIINKSFIISPPLPEMIDPERSGSGKAVLALPQSSTSVHSRTKSSVLVSNTSVPESRDTETRTSTDMCVCFPELNVIGVQGSHSQSSHGSDIDTEIKYAKEFVARFAKSGPVDLPQISSTNKIKSRSASSLKSTKSFQSRPSAISTTFRNSPQPSVSKTMPQGQDNNVTVFFSVTVPKVPSQMSHTDTCPDGVVGGTSEMGVGTDEAYSKVTDVFGDLSHMTYSDDLQNHFCGGPRALVEISDDALQSNDDFDVDDDDNDGESDDQDAVGCGDMDSGFDE